MFTKAIIRPNVSPSEYHSMGSKIERGNPAFIMSNSQLKAFMRSPSKWRAGYGDTEPSSSLEFGDILDCLVTTPERFETDYAITPETYPTKGTMNHPTVNKPWNRIANYCKEWEAEQEAKGLTVIKHQIASSAHKAKSILRKNAELWQYIESCQRQVCIVAEWHDEGTGITVPLKCLLDLVPSDNSLLDFKTTFSAEPWEWRKTVLYRSYHMQGALYLDACNVAKNEKRDTFRHIVQESEEPYEFFLRELSVEFLQLGRAAYQRSLADYCRCLEDNFWPNYDEMGSTIIDGWALVEPEPWMIMTDK